MRFAPFSFLAIRISLAFQEYAPALHKDAVKGSEKNSQIAPKRHVFYITEIFCKSLRKEYFLVIPLWVLSGRNHVFKSRKRVYLDSSGKSRTHGQNPQLVNRIAPANDVVILRPRSYP
jgi:hypothetical protein